VAVSLLGLINALDNPNSLGIAKMTTEEIGDN